jgi:AcrR family transcriptional regulator
VGVTDTATEVDGRRLRRQLNREAVIDALVELFEAGDYTPSTNDVAERAGISPRSLFRYFDDVDDLHLAAIDRQLVTARPLLEIELASDAPLAERIERVVRARVRLHDATAPAARAARATAHRSPVIAAQLREGRSFLRNQLRRVFALELSGARSSLLPALDALCSFETYDLLRRAHGLSSTKTASALINALSALLRGDE